MSGASRERFVSPGSDRRALVLAALPLTSLPRARLVSRPQSLLGPRFGSCSPILTYLLPIFNRLYSMSVVLI